jgi:hypothetical protein
LLWEKNTVLAEKTSWKRRIISLPTKYAIIRVQQPMKALLALQPEEDLD